VSDAISESGSVAKQAGIDLSSYASMIGVLVEKTGLEGSQLGNALKTIITRTTKASKAAGTMDEDLSKAEASLRAVGIQVRSSDGEFRNFDDTMGDLAKKWSSLNDVQKSNISFNLSGTRQVNVMNSLMNGWQEYSNLVKKADDSAGVSLENQNKYLDSEQGKVEELGAIWDSIWTKSLDSSFLKGLTDIGIAVSNLIERFGGLKTAILGIAAIGVFKNLA
jgi:TP901 family phage tail tape measure protein